MADGGAIPGWSGTPGPGPRRGSAADRVLAAWRAYSADRGALIVVAGLPLGILWLPYVTTLSLQAQLSVEQVWSIDPGAFDPLAMFDILGNPTLSFAWWLVCAALSWVAIFLAMATASDRLRPGRSTGLDLRRSAEAVVRAAPVIVLGAVVAAIFAAGALAGGAWVFEHYEVFASPGETGALLGRELAYFGALLAVSAAFFYAAARWFLVIPILVHDPEVTLRGAAVRSAAMTRGRIRHIAAVILLAGVTVSGGYLAGATVVALVRLPFGSLGSGIEPILTLLEIAVSTTVITLVGPLLAVTPGCLYRDPAGVAVAPEDRPAD